MPRNEEDAQKDLQTTMSKNKKDIAQSEEKRGKDGGVSPPPAVGRRMLKFPDGTQVGLNGLADIMAELFAEGMKATHETAEEIIKRLEKRKNFIPESESVRREYAYALVREYGRYVEDRSAGRS